MHMWLSRIKFAVRFAGMAAAFCQLAACGNVRLQSFDQLTSEVAQSTYQADRKACAAHLDAADYRLCVERTERAFRQFKAERAPDARRP